MPAERMVSPAVWLSSLFFASLALFTDDYVIAGILPELARDLVVSDGMTGQLVTVFSFQWRLLRLCSPSYLRASIANA